MSNGANAVVGLIPTVVAVRVLQEVEKESFKKRKSMPRKKEHVIGLFSEAHRL